MKIFKWVHERFTKHHSNTLEDKGWKKNLGLSFEDGASPNIGPHSYGLGRPMHGKVKTSMSHNASNSIELQADLLGECLLAIGTLGRLQIDQNNHPHKDKTDEHEGVYNGENTTGEETKILDIKVQVDLLCEILDKQFGLESLPVTDTIDAKEHLSLEQYEEHCTMDKDTNIKLESNGVKKKIKKILKKKLFTKSVCKLVPTTENNGKLHIATEDKTELNKSSWQYIPRTTEKEAKHHIPTDSYEEANLHKMKKLFEKRKIHPLKTDNAVFSNPHSPHKSRFLDIFCCMNPQTLEFEHSNDPIMFKDPPPTPCLEVVTSKEEWITTDDDYIVLEL